MTILRPQTSPTTEQTPSTPHSCGHSAGLHGEDQPSQFQDFFSSSCLINTSTPPLLSVEKQEKLILRTPQPLHPSRRDVRYETRSPQQQQRLGHLATMGYCQPGAQPVLRALLHHPDWLLVDIRLTPWSYYPQWLGSALSVQFVMQYLHLPELGNLNDDDATLPIQLYNAQAGIRQLLLLLDAGRSCVLLCGCRNGKRCHRSLVADLLQRARPRLRVWHLTSDVVPAQSVEVTASSRGELGVSLDLTLRHAALREEVQETILVTPLTVSVTVPGRGMTTRHLDFVSWPNGGKPGWEQQEEPYKGALSRIPLTEKVKQGKETPSWNR